MSKDDVRKLLGGYATGTLTPEEHQALLAAAFEDQDLFNALADEEALRRYLADPSFRRDVLWAMDEKKPAPLAWLFRPRSLALAGSLAVAVLVAVGLRYQRQQHQMTQIAEVRPIPSQPAPRAENAAPPLLDRLEERATAPAARSARRVIPEEREMQAQAVQSAPAAPPPPAKPLLQAKENADFRAKDEAVSRDNEPVRVEADKLARAETEKKAPAPAEQAAAAGVGGQAPLQQIPGGGLRLRQQGMVAGEMSKTRADQVSMRLAAVPRRITAVSDTTVTLSIGSTQGVKLKDKLVVLRNGSEIGEVEITEVKETSSIGAYTGTAPAQVGDLIR